MINKIVAVLGVLAIALIGTILLMSGHAASSVISLEAEHGITSAPASYVNDTSASNGSAVKFAGTVVTVPPVPPAPPSTVDPSGQLMPTGDIPGWQQIFADNFKNSVALGQFPAAVSSTWGAYPDGWHDTSGNGTYNCTKVCSVAGGLLDMFIHTENGVHYVAVPYPKLPGASSRNGMLYGRYAVRFRADSLHGYKTAWLLWPDVGSKFPDGEIDYPENNLDSTIQAFVHWRGGLLEADKSGFFTTQYDQSWHTAVTEWTASGLRFYLDSSLIGQLTDTSKIPNVPMHYVLQTESSLFPAGSVPANTVAGHVQVDWVAVYKPTP